MKRFYITLPVLIAFALAGLAPQPVAARPLSKANKRSIECAMYKIQFLANLFDVKMPAEQKTLKIPEGQCGSFAGRTLKMPDWFAKELDRMEKTKVVYIPNEGTLSEADLWHRAFANIYAYLDRANKSLDPSQPVVLSTLSRGYVGNRINLIASLDRLNKDLVRGKVVYSMKDSMDGRGRALLSTFELINHEFYSTIESFTSPEKQKEDKYRQSVMAVVVLSNHLYSQFMGKPIPINPPPKETYAVTTVEKVKGNLLILLGSFFAFLCVYLIFSSNKQGIAQMLERYRAKSVVWAEDFNRQFLTIDVKYIVMGTILIFLIFGAMIGISVGGFGGVFAFLLILGFGAIVSIKMPETVLDVLKKSRGRKINAQLMDSLILLSNSLKSGMDIVQGFELVSKDMQPPIADEFGLVIKNYQLGTPFEKALYGMNERVSSRMLEYIIKAIIIQRQVGGNLTVIFSRLVENIREESKLEEKLDAMTAQQRIQSVVVGIMPFIMVGVMFLFRPDEMISFYSSGVGILVFFGCIIWILIGMKIIKKTGEIRV